MHGVPIGVTRGFHFENEFLRRVATGGLLDIDVDNGLLLLEELDHARKDVPVKSAEDAEFSAFLLRLGDDFIVTDLEQIALCLRFSFNLQEFRTDLGV